MKALFVLLLLALNAYGAEQEAVIRSAIIVDYGVYDVIRVGKEEAPKTAQGTIHILHARLDPALRKQTTTVEARVGSRFGIRYEVQGEPRLAVVPVHVRITHPEIKNPDTGRSGKIDEWDAETSIGVPRFVGWGFDHPYEIVPGDWQIQVFHGPTLLVEKKFQVVIAQ